MNIGLVSHGVSAALFLVLGALLCTSWRGRLNGALLVVAVILTMAWSACASLMVAADFRRGVVPYHILEVGRTVGWLVFLHQLLRPLIEGGKGIHRFLLNLRPAVFIAGAVVLMLDLFPGMLQGFGFGIDLRILGHLGLAVGGLAMLEQLFRNTRPEHRWATKYLYLGIGAIFAYDFYFYADALLFNRIDEHIWQARGFVSGMVVPLLAVSAARNPQWSLDIFLSRRVVLHTASILGAGLYLLVMAGVGYYIRLFGGTWGTALQMAFMFGAGVLLIVMLFSGHLRAAVKVFMSKHFFSYKYDYREEWLRFIQTLSGGTDDASIRTRAVRAIAEILDCPGGILVARDGRQGFRVAATWNMAAPDVRGRLETRSLAGFLERTEWVVEVDEFDSVPEVYAGLELPDWLRNLPRAWIVVPLMGVDTRLVGFIVLARPRAGRQINWEDRDLLKTAGRQVASYIALVDTTEALTDARQFDAFNRLSAYVVHDLKNVAAQLSLVVSNAVRHRNNPRFVDDAVRTVENATVRMNRMLGQLRKGEGSGGESMRVAVERALHEVVAACAARMPTPSMAYCEPGLEVEVSADRFHAVLCHLVQNAQEATPSDGKVVIRAGREGGMLVIEISDTGCGMDERYIREQLFRPFRTTKGNAGMGIGVYESREFARAMGGEIEVTSTPGIGTSFFLRVPHAAGGDRDRAVVHANAEEIDCPSH